MGKASKWIKSFLIGKREDKNKDKKKDENAPPSIKRRWSFRRSTSTRPTTNHKSTNSFDSMFMENSITDQFQWSSSLVYSRQSVFYYHAHSAHVAATKIQAGYRSYLARRALRALRALVKLQALARGYLVRKQITNVARSMRAVMAIQVRARIHRVQMADETLGTAKKSNAKLINEISIQRDRYKTATRLTTLESKIDIRNGLQRENNLKMCPTPSTDSSSTTCDRLHEELLSNTPQRIYSQDYTPSYMSNTSSSKAKTRSNSEPRRRPKLGTKQRSSRRLSSMDGENDGENKYPWLNGSHKSTNQRECGYNYISGIKPIVLFEPPVHLY